MSSGRIVLNGVGLHQGGGLTLLREFASAATGALGLSALDSRLDPTDRNRFTTHSVRFVAPQLAARLSASAYLAREAGADDVLFAFNSLPPVRRSRARTIVYVHAPHFAGLSDGIAYSPITAARIKMERLWFQLARANADAFWVQTATMAEALGSSVQGKPIRVMPFVATKLRDSLRAATHTSQEQAQRCRHYFYPADDVAHKNHVTLLKSWVLLGNDGLFPRLELTLRESELAAALADANIAASQLPHVTTAGRLTHDEVLARFAGGADLVFPSLTESFGLPLMEAAAAGVGLVVAERDYARDVVTADESFDPTSARSLADAVRRHLGLARVPVVPLDAAQLVAELLA